jgi:lysophospholipase L1-like esterase
LAALQSGNPVTIIAIGGASTRGRAAGDDSRAWPSRLGQVLTERFPKAKITVLNRGVARESAAQMVARFDKDVLAYKPDLVIWETATNDAVSGTDVDAFRETLQEGVERLRATEPEVMLMNPQFSRLSEFVVNFNRYTIILRGVADLNELPLFPRHEIMRYWAETGVFDYRVNGREQRRELAIQLYACIGTAVADMIMRQYPTQVR